MAGRNVDRDVRFMRRAIALARRGEGRVEPNPMVGCVLVRGGRVIGEGYHRRFGGPHAEVEALGSCTGARGATAYVTLEPCCHYGKTPPCTKSLIDAGVSRVVVGCLDPNEKVSGGGLKLLKKAGVETAVGIEEATACQLILPFRRWVVDHRPYVIAKWAQSIDGKIATRTGASNWISGASSRRLVHRLRARVDAVMAGSGTVRIDDPRLTARGVRIRRRAARVVWDTRLRTTSACNVVADTSAAPTIILTARKNVESRAAAILRAKGVDILGCRTARGGLSVRDGLRKLAQRGMTNVLLEGGAMLTASFIDAGLVDEAWVFVAPLVLGGTGAPSALPGRGFASLDDARRRVHVASRRVGEDHFYKVRFLTSD